MGNPSDDFFIRCSALSGIMTTGRSKDQIFGKTAIDQILEAALLNKRGWSEEISGKPLEKGIANEDQALDILCKNKKWKVERTKERMFNDFITGEPDLMCKKQGILADVKNSFTPKSFPWLVDTSDLKKHNKNYWYQMQGYMWLSGIKKCTLAYCLTDFPSYMILDEIQRISYRELALPKNRGIDMSIIEDQVEKKVNEKWTYGQFPESKKIKMFEVDFDTEEIEKIKNRIVEARKIYDTIYESI
jgi:hypothetical protein